MDSPDLQSGAVSRLVYVLRSVTRAVQVLPFAYLFVLAVYLITQSLLPDWLQSVADCVLNVPVYVIAVMLGAGRLLKLCGWFRSACLLPMVTKVEGWMDSFVVTFTQNEVLIINLALGILLGLFLSVAYKHFFRK